MYLMYKTISSYRYLGTNKSTLFTSSLVNNIDEPTVPLVVYHKIIGFVNNDLQLMVLVLMYTL